MQTTAHGVHLPVQEVRSLAPDRLWNCQDSASEPFVAVATSCLSRHSMTPTVSKSGLGQCGTHQTAGFVAHELAYAGWHAIEAPAGSATKACEVLWATGVKAC